MLRSYPEFVLFDGYEMNARGTRLLQAGRAEDALAVFQLNAVAYPEVADCYDSLGRAYRVLGDREAAIRNYKKVLELDPEFADATEALQLLERPKQE